MCDGRPIRAIRVETSSVFSPDDSAYASVVRDAGNVLHWRTREDVVRRELRFVEGEGCDPRRLAESARILRAQPYIRDAVITPAGTPDGGLVVFVRTRDEWSLRGSARLDFEEDLPIRRLRVVEENFLGRGIRLQGRLNLLGREPAYDFEVTHHQFLHRRLDAQLLAGKSSVGPIGEQTILRPFESEFDRFAWRQSSRYRKEPFLLVSPALGRVEQPVVAVGTDAGAAWRFGRPGHLMLVGAALSLERLLIDGAPLADQPGEDLAAAAALAGRFTERRRVRTHLFFGVRALEFHGHLGVDAVNRREDVREGVEVGLVVGKSLFGEGGLQRDWFAAAETFYGADVEGRMLIFARAKAEARYLIATGRWDGVLADGQVFVYNNVSGRGVLVLGAAAAGGWKTRAPYQLLLAGPSGIRGHGFLGHPVGRRIVIQGEHRYFVGTAFGTADVGTAAFVDVGRGWAGDAAFGEDTGLLTAAGVGLRVAAPRGSRVTYRLDLAVPLGRGRGVELRLGIRQQFGVLRGEPDDVARSREQVSSTTVFNFPRF